MCLPAESRYCRTVERSAVEVAITTAARTSYRTRRCYEATYVPMGRRLHAGDRRRVPRDGLPDAGLGSTEGIRSPARHVANLRDHDTCRDPGADRSEPSLPTPSVGQVRLSNASRRAMDGQRQN